MLMAPPSDSPAATKPVSPISRQASKTVSARREIAVGVRPGRPRESGEVHEDRAVAVEQRLDPGPAVDRATEAGKEDDGPLPVAALFVVIPLVVMGMGPAT
ncbi:hypothetical protein [Thermocatellispora tengchongensis]|uniref:hypothetical protein n=1 Tax=Thermocatellispora tengchongensis TaxID=1073253 RepID=UPI00362F27DB